MSTQHRYDYMRSSIKDGDILLYKGSGWFSALIKFFTKSKYSHAGIVCWWNNRLMVLEAVGKGVIVTPLSKNIKEYPGTVELFFPNKISEAQRKKIISFAQIELGKEYSIWKLFLYMFTKKDKRDAYRKENKLFCSHFVASTYNYAGYDIVKGTSDSYTTPEDIATSDKISFKGNLK